MWRTAGAELYLVPFMFKLDAEKRAEINFGEISDDKHTMNEQYTDDKKKKEHNLLK